MANDIVVLYKNRWDRPQKFSLFRVVSIVLIGVLLAAVAYNLLLLFYGIDEKWFQAGFVFVLFLATVYAVSRNFEKMEMMRVSPHEIQLLPYLVESVTPTLVFSQQQIDRIVLRIEGSNRWAVWCHIFQKQGPMFRCRVKRPEDEPDREELFASVQKQFEEQGYSIVVE